MHSNTWTQFFTSNLLKTSLTRSLNHCHLLWRGWKCALVPALRWAISLRSHGNAIVRVGFRQTYTTILTTCLQCMESTNISSVRSRTRAGRPTMTTCWFVNTLFFVSQVSTTEMVSGSSWLQCHILRLSGSGNYTLWRRWDGMTITNTLSNTQVETSSEVWDGWCGSQPMPSISFTPLSVALTVIPLWNTSIPICTLRTCRGRHR